MLINIEHDFLNKLTDTEKNVISFINGNAESIANMSISDVAEATYSSPATVSRTIKKCGISGFAELRYMLTQQVEAKQDSVDVNEIFNKSLLEISNTIESLSIDTILKAVDILRNANRVFIFSKGLSNNVASELALKLQVINMNVIFNSDSNIMQEISSHAGMDTAVIIFSMSGSTPELISAAEKASMMGAKIISITCAPPELPLNRLAHVRIKGYCHHNRTFTKVDVTSRLPLYVMSRILVDYLMLQYQQDEVKKLAKDKSKSKSYHNT